MVTFGDLMALLLTFFVMMLSLSNINQQKYESVSEAMGESFGLQKLKMPNTQKPSPEDKSSLIEPPIRIYRDQRPVDVILQEDFRQELDSGLFSLNEGQNSLSVSFPEYMAFQAGSAELTDNFIRLLQKMAVVLSNSKGDIVVAGHTDDEPINNSRFKSNWDLSSARAVAVVKELIATGMVEPGRLSAVAYADTHPLVPNQNAELRKKNRRVEIRIKLTR